MSDRRARHRDDEDFTVRTDPRDNLDAQLRALPRFSDLIDPEPSDDELAIPVEMLDAAEVSIAIDGLVEVTDADSSPVLEFELPPIPPPPPALRANTLARAVPVAPAAPVPVVDDELAIHRAATRPLEKGALAVRAMQLAAERRIAQADGRTPVDDRFPGQGTARRKPPQENDQ